MLEINQLTLQYFQAQFHGSWGQRYLAHRLGHDLFGDDRFQPGQAPGGWAGLVDHLRGRGVRDAEMVATGVATIASTGRPIDRFRDRVVFPIVHRGEVLGFVGRRHPDLTDADRCGPKYLNTADTPLFHKGAQLFGADAQRVDPGAVPVLVEGPLDAVAVTIAASGAFVGVSPLGTSLTDEQAAQLGRLGGDPVVATDADLAGHVAAERAYWLLTPHGLDPGYAAFPTGSDPADVLATRGPDVLRDALAAARPLAEVLIDERKTNLPAIQARIKAIRVVAARPAQLWDAGDAYVSTGLPGAAAPVRRELLEAVREWNRDPRAAAQLGLQEVTDVRGRLAEHAAKPTHERWATLAKQLDESLLEQGDWPALATVMQDAHDRGHDVGAAARFLLAEAPLSKPSAQDLRYRLVSRLRVDVDVDVRSADGVPETPARGAGSAHERRQPLARAEQPGGRQR